MRRLRVALGGPGGAGNRGDLTGGVARRPRTAATLAAIERATADTGTLWAATSTGRVFISKNADAEPASAVTFTRLDSLVGERTAEPVPQRHLRRPGEPEPRLDLVLGLQHDGRLGRHRATSSRSRSTRPPAPRRGSTGATTWPTCRSPMSPSTIRPATSTSSTDFGVLRLAERRRRRGTSPATGSRSSRRRAHDRPGRRAGSMRRRTAWASGI